MTIFKCKMCGGTLEFTEGASVATCEYCGTKQTLPKLDDDKKATLYERANHFRRNNEFDKAMGIYEMILNEDETDAEAYWSLVLCRYGVEYVEDPTSRKRIPTVNRAQYTPVSVDPNYQKALSYADVQQKEIYEQEAKAIDEIQKGILAISQKEEPFDVFICYKETDELGQRTPDSVMAHDLYNELTREGLKVFYARITLEDKLGTAYEPYIFAALNSAKVMVVVGTKKEYMEAVWVKNEWSRYLSLIKDGAKKTIIPAYKEIEGYDLPNEFMHLQAQNMSKLGAMQDLVHAVHKLVKASPVVEEPKKTTGGVGEDALLKRMQILLEKKEWDEAKQCCERILDIDMQNGYAYAGKLMADLHVAKMEDLAKCAKRFDKNKNYKNAMECASAELKGVLEQSLLAIKNRNRKIIKKTLGVIIAAGVLAGGVFLGINAEIIISRYIAYTEALNAWNEFLAENDLEAVSYGDMSDGAREAIVAYNEAMALAEDGDVEAAQSKLEEFVRYQYNLHIDQDLLDEMEQNIMDKIKENR